MLAVLVLVVIAVVARAVVHAAEVALQVALITAVTVLGLAVVALVACAALRARARHATDRQAIPGPTRTGQQAVQGRSEPRAIEAPRPALADLQVLTAQHSRDLTRRAPDAAGDD